MIAVTDDQQTVWILEGIGLEGQCPPRIPITSNPFRIGRNENLSLCLTNRNISKRHAELELRDDQLSVRDLYSTNGTFVNGQRITEETPLHSGDQLQLSGMKFRIRTIPAGTDTPSSGVAPADWAISIVQFDNLMSSRAVVPYFQPIVSLKDEPLIGYEILSRSHVKGMESPAAMFAAAQQFEQEEQLSQMLRQEGVRVGNQLSGEPTLFVNTHPKEIVTHSFIASLVEIRDSFCDIAIAVEIHEGAVTDRDEMQLLRVTLDELEMQLAFDDFGTGQARLMELIDVKPHYVKFDMRMIRNLHKSSVQHRQVVEMLVNMVRYLEIASVAEGIEYEQEAEVCRELGFDFAQGYFFGRPQPVDDCGESRLATETLVAGNC